MSFGPITDLSRAKGKPRSRRAWPTCVMVAVGLLAVGIQAGSSAADMTVADYSPNVNDRFNDSPDFLGAAYNFSGVGYVSTSTGPVTWATMISPQYFVSATHFYPGEGGVAPTQLTFHSTNNPNTGIYTATIETGYPVYDLQGNPSDLWLGMLTEPIPASADISYYPIAYSPSGNYIGLGVYMYGLPNRLGYNVITGTSQGDVINSEYSHFFDWTYNSTVANESYGNPGDSGGPSFAVVNGSLALIGTTTFPEAATLVPYYLQRVQALMALTDSQPQVVAVPEPPALSLLGIGVLALGLRRRTRRGGRGASDTLEHH